jgi:hypothetical protein
MPDFNAGLLVEPISYDFTAFGGPQGTVVEPSQTKMRAFSKKLQAKFGTSDPAKLGEILKAMTPEEQEALIDEQQALIAELCGGCPSLEDLQNLPQRVLTAFLGYLMGELVGVDPKARGSAGTGS